MPSGTVSLLAQMRGGASSTQNTRRDFQDVPHLHMSADESFESDKKDLMLAFKILLVVAGETC